MEENPYKAPLAPGTRSRRSKSRSLDKTLALNLAVLFLAIALATFAFGFWGTFTEAGRLRYDEMDGIIPELAIVASSVPAVVAILFFIVAWRHR